MVKIADVEVTDRSSRTARALVVRVSWYREEDAPEIEHEPVTAEVHYDTNGCPEFLWSVEAQRLGIADALDELMIAWVSKYPSDFYPEPHEVREFLS